MNRINDVEKMAKSRKSVPKEEKHPSDRDMEHSSFVSKISDCSSCDQNKIKNSLSIGENCKSVLQEFFDSVRRIGKAAKKSVKARHVASKCLDYVNVILVNVEWLEREKNNAVEENTRLTVSIKEIEERNSRLEEEIAHVEEGNEQLRKENDKIMQECRAEELILSNVFDETEVFRTMLEARNAEVTQDLERLANASIQVEADIVHKQVIWEKIIYNLQNRVAQLQKENEALRANVELVCNVLMNGNGDLDAPQQLVDAVVLEAYYEAEVVMTKHEHKSFISELNKLNYKLWNEKFFARSRIDDEIRKRDVYRKCLQNLETENKKLRDQIYCSNKEIEELLDVICLKIKNKCH